VRITNIQFSSSPGKELIARFLQKSLEDAEASGVSKEDFLSGTAATRELMDRYEKKNGSSDFRDASGASDAKNSFGPKPRRMQTSRMNEPL